MDALVVLGDSLESSEAGYFKLSEFAKQRANKAVELYNRNPVPIIMSGRHWCLLEDIPDTTEAWEMAQYAIQSGVPKLAILQENESMDTIGNAYFTKIRILEPKNWRNLAVITSDFHILRTKYVFNKVLGADYNINFIAAPSNLSEQELEIKEYQEKEILNNLFKPLLDSVESGDHESAGHIILTKLPGYSSEPEYCIEDILEIVMGNKNI